MKAKSLDERVDRLISKFHDEVDNSDFGVAVYELYFFLFRKMKRERNSLEDMTVNQAVVLLGSFHSSQDPIVYIGKNTQPQSFGYDSMFDHWHLAKDVKITYYSISEGRWVVGSLLDMVVDRGKYDDSL